MKLRCLCVGRISSEYLRAGIEDYTQRVRRYLPFDTVEIKEEKGGEKKGGAPQVRDREGARLCERIPAGAFTVVLDEGGKAFSSQEFSELLDRQMLYGAQEMVFVIGGAYGLSDAVKKRGNFTLSLSSMTFTHQMARLILLEQIYRGLTILRNEPYHNP